MTSFNTLSESLPKAVVFDNPFAFPRKIWKVCVGGLAPTANEFALRKAFSVNGKILKAEVVVDRKNGKSGFVSFVDPEGAWRSIDTMDQWELHQQTVTVRMAMDCQDNMVVRDRGNGIVYDDPNQYKTPSIPFNILYLKSPLTIQNYRCNHSSVNSEASCEILGSGMILIKNYITLSAQVGLLNLFQKWGAGPGGFYEPRNQRGQILRHHMMCLGRNWDPVTGYANRYKSDGSEPLPLSGQLSYLSKHAIDYAGIHLVELPNMCPDTCIVNFFSRRGRLGIHQDCDESFDSLDMGLPVVSIFIGESAEYWYGHTRDENKFSKVVLKSGDVLVYGGASRGIFHGVKDIIPSFSPVNKVLNIRSGCLTLTLKQY